MSSINSFTKWYVYSDYKVTKIKQKATLVVI